MESVVSKWRPVTFNFIDMFLMGIVVGIIIGFALASAIGAGIEPKDYED